MQTQFGLDRARVGELLTWQEIPLRLRKGIEMVLAVLAGPPF